MPSKPHFVQVEATYRSSRLLFRAAVIEDLAAEASFRVDTPHGSFQMRKSEFYETFNNVRRSRSYRETGTYHYTKVPKKALIFLVGSPSTPATPTVTNKNRRLSAVE